MLEYRSAACAFIPDSKIAFISPPSLHFFGLHSLKIHKRLFFSPPDPSCLFLSCFNFPTRFIPATCAPVTDDPGSGIGHWRICSPFIAPQAQWAKGVGRSKEILQPSHSSTSSQCSHITETSKVLAVIQHAAIFPIFPKYLLFILFLVMEERCMAIWGENSHFKGKVLRQPEFKHSQPWQVLLIDIQPCL